MNPYSTIHNYAEPDYSPDFQFINAALSFKQERLDTNRAKLQNLYDQFSVLQVKKGVDQKYIEDRLTQVRDITNKYASMDLSDPNFAASLMTNTGQILDDKVKTAILSTKMIAAEDTYWRDMEKNKPDMYSKLNHQYALAKSDRQRYLTTTETGDAYRGGADFIEYRDLSKKLMDNIPILQKTLHAEWKETGPGEGHFRSLDTYEAVPPAKLQAALKTIFDEKDMQQINIDAWGKYDSLSDTDLEATFSSHFNTQLENNQEKLAALQVAYNTEGNSSRKQELKGMLDEVVTNIQQISSHSYKAITDKFGAERGKEAAYQTLHRSEYFTGIAETYGYEKRLIDQQVDEVQKANLEYQLKLDNSIEAARHNIVQENETARHHMAMENKGSKSSDGSGKDLGEGIYLGGKTEVDPADNKDDYIKAHYDDRQKAYDNAIGTLKGVLPNLSEDTIKNSMRDPQFRSDLKNLANKTSIKIGGQTVQLTSDVVAALDQYRVKYVDRSAADKQTYKNVETAIGQINEQLKKTAAFGSPDMNIYGLPNFNFRLEKGKDGKFAYKFIKPGKGAHNYAYLAKNGAKTEGDAVTQKVYTALHLYRDPNISSVKKQATKDYIYSVLLPQLDKNGRDAVNKAMGGLRNVTTTKMGAEDYWLTEFTKGDTEVGDVNRRSNIGLQGLATYSRWVNNQPGVAAVLENKMTPEVETQGLNTIIDNAFNHIGTELNNVYSSNRKLAENANVHFEKTFANYDELKRMGNVGLDSYKDDVVLKVRFEDGEPTDTVDIFTYTKLKDNPNKVLQQTGTTTKQELEKREIVLFDTKRYNTYDARVKEYANTIPLGNLQWDEDKRKANGYQAQGNHSISFQDDNVEYTDYIYQVASTDGEEVAKELLTIVGEYISGKYTFDLQPTVRGDYEVSMKENGQEVYSVPARAQDLSVLQVLSDDYVQAAYQDPRPLAEATVKAYIEKVRRDKR